MRARRNSSRTSRRLARTSYPRHAAHRQRRLSGEQLEPRTLLELTPLMLADINTGPAGFFVRGPIVEMGSAAYFAGGYGLGDYELWKSDGTTAGTVLLKDINPGVGGSSPKNLININGTLWFAATSGSGDELWKSDGTAAGTVLVKEIEDSIVGSSPAYFTEVNGTVFFTAFDFDAGTELWKTDGTAAGTVRVKDIVPGFFSPAISDLVNFNGTLYFSASQDFADHQLWKRDRKSVV